jgi:ribosome-associated protein
MPELKVTGSIVVDESEIEERFVQASGPGGQNVNKVATAVQLRFYVAGSRSLPQAVKARLATLAGRRLSADGILVIDARRHRTQERNRADARERLVDLIARAAIPVVKRVPTRPTLASKRRRIEGKKRRSAVKRTRSGSVDD